MLERIKLKHLILSIVFISFLLTISISLFSAYKTNTATLQQTTLESNQTYAKKIAVTTNTYLDEIGQSLAFSAGLIERSNFQKEIYNEEMKRLLSQSHVFNTVVVSNENGYILSATPASLHLQGTTPTSIGLSEALRLKKPNISKPYHSITGHLVIFISHPIFSSSGTYEGLIGGTIYLDEENMFNHLLGEHFYGNNSYVYIVDSSGHLIYHPDSTRLDELVIENAVVRKVIAGQDGAERITNTKGVDMLAGYSYIEKAQWGVVAQRPTVSTLAPAKYLVKNSILTALPFIIFFMIIILLATSKIVDPLHKMAALSYEHIEDKDIQQFSNIRSWYFEAFQLKKALEAGFSTLQTRISTLKQESSTDELTGLMNRRSMNQIIQKWQQEQMSYSVIMLDIDHFKTINDTFGHQIGDEMLRFLATKMQTYTRPIDVCCRYGGEEFIILLPNTSEKDAFVIAEMLRKHLEQTISPCNQTITISGGVAVYPEHGSSMEEVIQTADKLLYFAKQTGRNKIITLTAASLYEDYLI